MPIYNLEIGRGRTLNIDGYTFSKVENYDEAFRGLAHRVNLGGEPGREIRPQTGAHQITATVDVPTPEVSAILPWATPQTALMDMLLLLSIFTGREVFQKDWDGDRAIIRDPRMHEWGGQLRTSAPFVGAWEDSDTGEVVSERPAEVDIWKYEYIDIGLDRSLNAILERMRTNEWKNKYGNGYFLFLYRDAVRVQILERSFQTCWTIWEQFFALHHRDSLTEEDIYRTSGKDKIEFILTEYFKIKPDDKGRGNIKRLTRSRNRLVHFGRKTENVENTEKIMFIRLTEQLVAITLGLEPSNVLNSQERLQEFLKK